MGICESTESSTNSVRSRHCDSQNCLLVWLDENIDVDDEYYQNTFAELRCVIKEVNPFTTLEQCIKFLKDLRGRKAVVISSGALALFLVPNIHNMLCVDTIYILCHNKTLLAAWIKKWIKIQDIFTSIKSICDSLKAVTHECEYKTQLPPTFLYSTLFKEIILEIEDDDAKSLKEFISHCHKRSITEDELQDFQHEYHLKSPVWWCTCNTFFSRMLDRALCSFDIETMIKMGFFIRKLHYQLEQLHQEQTDLFKEKFLVYHAQEFTAQEMKLLLNRKSELLSFNNFLLTSKEKQSAMLYVDHTHTDENHAIVLFTMTIDPSTISASTISYALIDGYSAVSREQAILFSMHSVFHVEDVRKAADNSRLWEVQLTLVGNNDLKLSALTDYMRDEIQASTTWFRMGKLLLRVGHFSEAEELYHQLFQNSPSDTDKAFIYQQLGYIKNEQGDYNEAIRLYKKSFEIHQKMLPVNDIALVPLCAAIGLVYNNMGDYSKALEFHQDAIKIKENFLPASNLNIAWCYNSFGQLYYKIGDYRKALDFYEKSYAIYMETLPTNHPDIGRSYNSIGQVYYSIGNYSKAFQYYSKAHDIYEQVLPSNHPDFARSYNNMGQLFYNMGDYSNALTYYKTAHEIYRTVLSPNHPDLASIHNNIGQVYYKINDYSNAFEFHEKAIKTREIMLPLTHPDFARSYNNIGLVYNNMGNYLKALEYYERAREIYEKTLPPNHPDLATFYNNIALAYNNMDEYTKALQYYEKDIEITKLVLPSNHPALATSYNNIGLVYNNIGEHVKALSFLEQALVIFQTALPSTHSNIETVKNSIKSLKKSV